MFIDVDKKPPTVDEMNEKAEEYFARKDDERRPYTFAGLARACGLSTDQLKTLMDTENPYGTIMRDAKLRLEERLEEGLYDKSSATGARFVLMNKCGWSEKSETRQEGSLTVAWEE